MNFGDKLKNLRNKIGKSQAKVATEMSKIFPDFSISQTYLSTLEQREDTPKRDVVDFFAEYFNVPLSYFYDGEPIVTPEDEQRRMDVADNWIENLRNATLTGKPFARAEGYQKEDDEISKNLDNLRRNIDEDDEILDF